jgi:hypothetical protein
MPAEAAGRRNPGRLSLEYDRLENPASIGPSAARCGRTSPNLMSPDFASLLNIAHLHVRFARQVGERTVS